LSGEARPIFIYSKLLTSSKGPTSLLIYRFYPFCSEKLKAHSENYY
jgi:hypothetical protein